MVTSPSDHRYGKYRLVERKEVIDMTHVKRIRGCPSDKDKVDVVVTMKTRWEDEKVRQEDIQRIREKIGIAEGEELAVGEIKVPHQAIYVKDTFEKYKENANSWPLTFST